MANIFPKNGRWTQTNNSNRIGSLSYSRNINLDSEGCIKLSPRTVNLMDDTGNVASTSDAQFGTPIALGRTSIGNFYVATTDSQFNLDVDNTTKTIAEDTSPDNPALTDRSHGAWWQNRWYVSLTSSVSYLAGTWTAGVITGLSTSFRHYMAVFKNRNTLCVSNGNVLKQYNSDHSASVDLTIPADFEITGVAYNNQRVGIVTRLGTSSAGQNQSSMFYIWDGTTTGNNGDAEIGADFALGIVAYKSSFVVLTNEGQLLYWNGGGFDELASFPFYFDSQKLGDLINHITLGDIIKVEGDVIYINIGIQLSPSTKKGESPKPNSPAGVWCFDPKVGLYHRWSASNSKCYLHTITTGNINTTTNVFTTTNVIPPTGNPVRLTYSGGVVGITEGNTYYVIKLSSTTFKLASTKALALAETGIDITATGADSSYFWMYDIVDYGILIAEQGSKVGTIGIWGNDETNYSVATEVLFGGNYLNRSLSSQSNLCSSVPFLPNVGYFVLTSPPTGHVSDNIVKAVVKYKPLDVDDKIIVKVKNKDILNIPYGSPQYVSQSASGEATWSSEYVFTTTGNLADVKTAFDAGEEMELELIAGAGSGQIIKITNITESSGTYTVQTEEFAVGATIGSKSYFIIDNWKVCGSADHTSQSDGILEVAISKTGKSPEVKVEMRGYNVTIQDAFIDNKPHKQL
jgi:hypothetical protein